MARRRRRPKVAIYRHRIRIAYCRRAPCAECVPAASGVSRVGIIKKEKKNAQGAIVIPPSARDTWRLYCRRGVRVDPARKRAHTWRYERAVAVRWPRRGLVTGRRVYGIRSFFSILAGLSGGPYRARPPVGLNSLQHKVRVIACNSTVEVPFRFLRASQQQHKCILALNRAIKLYLDKSEACISFTEPYGFRTYGTWNDFLLNTSRR